MIQGPQDIASPVGTTVTFSCTARSEPQHTIIWKFNNVVIISQSKYTIETTSTVSNLTIMDIQVEDAGTFSCTVSNIHGNDTASGQLDVQSE